MTHNCLKNFCLFGHSFVFTYFFYYKHAYFFLQVILFEILSQFLNRNSYLCLSHESMTSLNNNNTSKFTNKPVISMLLLVPRCIQITPKYYFEKKKFYMKYIIKKSPKWRLREWIIYINEYSVWTINGHIELNISNK